MADDEKKLKVTIQYQVDPKGVGDAQGHFSVARGFCELRLLISTILRLVGIRLSPLHWMRKIML